MRSSVVILSLLISVICPAALAEVLTCEQVLAGSKAQLFSSYNFNIFSIGRENTHSYTTKIYKPKSGVGKLIHIKPKVIDEKKRPPILICILRYPEFFARFDMYASGDSVVMPDHVRLNSLLKNGVQFESAPFFFWRYYFEDEFDAVLETGKILIGSNGPTFYHDRMEDHLTGALILPAWLYQKYLQYNKFDQAVIALRSDPNLTEQDQSFLNYYTSTRSSPGRNWDVTTNLLGLILEKDFPKKDEPVEKAKIQTFVETLRRRTNSLTPGATSLLRDSMGIGRNAIQVSPYFKTKILEIEKQFITEYVNQSFIISEAIRILHEVTGLSVEKLNRVWEDKE